MKQLLLGIPLLVFVLSLSAPVLGQEPEKEPTYVPGEILVKFKDEAGVSAQSVLAAQGLAVLEVSPFSGVMRVRVTPGQELVAIAGLSTSPTVEYAEPNHILWVAGNPNDPHFSKQWALHNTGQSGGFADADIDAPEAWNIHTGGSSVVVAIVDTGIDRTHEDLVDRIWKNSREYYGQVGVDDDSNGFVDDIYGWNFCCGGSNNNTLDDNDHGTLMAGIIGATGNNGKGIAGVSWRATLMAVKAMNSSGNGTVFAVANGVDYAANNGANVINLSLVEPGTEYPCPTYTTLRQAMQRALDKGVLITVASGNQAVNKVACPAALDESFAVGATNPDDTRRSSSNYGAQLDVVAPGTSISSTLRSGGYTTSSGTSMATAHVSGLAALLWSYHPTLKNNDVRSIIEVTADDLWPPGWDIEFGHGRINAHTALKAVRSFRTTPGDTGFLAADNMPISPTTLTTTVNLLANDTVTINWTASISPPVSWLGFDSPDSGSMPGGVASMQMTLAATQPLTYGLYTANLIVEAEKLSGEQLGTRTTRVWFNYIPEAKFYYLPVMFKNGG